MTATVDLNNNDPSSSLSTENAVVTDTTTDDSAYSAVVENKEHKEKEAAVLPPTDMLYYTYEGNFLKTCQATVLSIEEKKSDAEKDGNSKKDEDDTNAVLVDVCLDQTVLHAQGGGQPTDHGSLVLLNDDDNNETVVMTVDKVLMDRATGVATHTGRLPNNSSDSSNSKLLRVGEQVKVIMDEERRQLLSEAHTAGHVVDSAMAVCGKLLKPSKGYHFLDSPYVEYQGSIPLEERDSLLKDLQQAYCKLVNDDMETKIENMSKQEADAICNRQAQNFDMDVFADPQTQQIRVVTVAGYPCPCGGTHVPRTGDLKARGWNITGIKSKQGKVRVKYGQGSNGKKK